MAVDACLLACGLSRDALASQDIFPVGYGFEVIRIDAGPHPTEMVKFQPDRNRPMDFLPGSPVS